jgi:ribose transport system permease protein
VGVGVCGLAGLACGALNGGLVVGLRVHPFIITLGTMAVLRGVVFVATSGQSITGIPASFSAGLVKAELWGVYPVPMLVMLGVALAGHVVLTRLVLGRRVFAIGGNETAAAYAGIRVGLVKVVVFSIGGLLAGISAAVYLGYYAAFEPNAGNGYELSVIAATVIGGASLSGGRGSALGAVLGALLIQLITNAMIILNIDSSYTSIVMGAAIVAAVVLDQAKSRVWAGAARAGR